jgi:RimJ/RimL family protein N-acetyltransferase
MTDTRIVDYDIFMKGKIRRLFADIYPDQPEIVDRMCYDPSIPNHVATKVAYVGDAMVGQTNIFLHKALDGNANLGFHVHPSIRGRGIATILSNEVINVARSKGISVLYIRTLKDNFAAIAVAGKLGFHRDDSRFADMGFAVYVKHL